MVLKEYVKQYTNYELCNDWSNNIPLSELQDDFYLCLDSQDIDFICDYFSFLPHDDITGYVGKIGEGDYVEVYITESSRPYDLQAIYHPLEYYL